MGDNAEFTGLSEDVVGRDVFEVEDVTRPRMFHGVRYTCLTVGK
jgi:hypothetical protein